MRARLVAALLFAGAPALAQTANLPNLEPPGSQTEDTGRPLVPPARDPHAKQRVREQPGAEDTLTKGASTNFDLPASLDLPQTAPPKRATQVSTRQRSD